MTQTELLQEVLELIESAIKAGDWVVDGACDPDMTIHRIKEALAQQNEFNPDWDAMAVMVEEQQRMAKRIEELEAQPEQEPVAWMGADVDGNPNKFRLNFFSGAIPLFTTLEDRSLIANNEKNGSPCPEFWDWFPKAYNFDGDGTFTKYNMEVAFLAGKRSVATSDTPQERVDETVKQRTWVGLTRQEFQEATEGLEDLEDCWIAIEAKLKEKNT